MPVQCLPYLCQPLLLQGIVYLLCRVEQALLLGYLSVTVTVSHVMVIAAMSGRLFAGYKGVVVQWYVHIMGGDLTSSLLRCGTAIFVSIMVACYFCRGTGMLRSISASITL